MRCRTPKSPFDLSAGSLSSMIDIIFLLIIFFVVTASFDDAQLDESIELPGVAAGTAPKALPPERMTVNVRADGAVTIGYHRIPPEQVPEALPPLLAGETGKGVKILILNGDGAARHKVIAPVLEAAAAAGFRDVRINAVVEEPR